MENYREKFEKNITNTKFDKLETKTQDFIKTKAFEYKLTFMELKQLVDMSIDLHMWDEKPLHVIWEDFKDKKKTLLHIKSIYDDLRAKPKSYSNFKAEKPKDNKFDFFVYKKDELALGSCPVASPKTRCCNLMTLDAVESCGFDCSYCSIQSFYNENKIGFDSEFANKLKNLKLDPNKNYHIGTGQSSDSLMWGNKHGILEALFDFARKNQNVVLELKTKSDNISYLLENDVPKNILCTWSLNTPTIIQNEEHLSASLEKRISSARKLADKGVLVGFHFHPIVVYENYLQEYKEVVNTLLKNFKPEEVVLVSLGTLTFIKPVINKLRSRNFKSKILQMPLVDASGKQSYPLEVKEEMFKGVYEAFKEWHNKVYFYMCMEDQSLWKKVFGYEYAHNDEMELDMISSYMSKIHSNE
ncbi:radical SAM protein [Sulfurospirillum sp. 1307]|jgi:spore photoproduct lyase